MLENNLSCVQVTNTCSAFFLNPGIGLKTISFGKDGLMKIVVSGTANALCEIYPRIHTEKAVMILDTGGGRWKSLHFESCCELVVKILCVLFLPDSANRVKLISSLRKQYKQ